MFGLPVLGLVLSLVLCCMVWAVATVKNHSYIFGRGNLYSCITTELANVKCPDLLHTCETTFELAISSKYHHVNTEYKNV